MMLMMIRRFDDLGVVHVCALATVTIIGASVSGSTSGVLPYILHTYRFIVRSSEVNVLLVMSTMMMGHDIVLDLTGKDRVRIR